MLELNHIHKMYNPGTINEICLFEDFNLKIDDGQFVSVVGSNGSGKTSMLNIICGSIPIDGGSIVVNGVVLSTPFTTIATPEFGIARKSSFSKDDFP